jgi:hypothetical protein
MGQRGSVREWSRYEEGSSVGGGGRWSGPEAEREGEAEGEAERRRESDLAGYRVVLAGVVMGESRRSWVAWGAW